MAFGALIGESLRPGATIEPADFRATRIVRCESVDESAGQPRWWTFIEFEVADEEATALADALAEALRPDGGWYCDFHTGAESYVVFAGRIFRYPRGDASGRSAAATYARSVGVPEHQLDWSV